MVRAAFSIVATLLLLSCGSQKGITEKNLSDASNASPLGQLVYKERCASCHGERGEGPTDAPAILGNGRLASSGRGFKTGQDVFDYVARKMPKDAPGSLPIRDYWAVSSFLVGGNGVEVPNGGLSDSSAPKIKLHKE